MTTKIYPLIVVVLMLCGSSIYAQSYQIKGSVLAQDGPLSFANVILNNQADSSLIKAEVTNDDGDFVFNNIAPGEYWLEVSYVGMQNFTSEVVRVAQNDLILNPFILKAASQDLEQVEVVSKAPMIEVLADKTVFNVENTLSATGTDGLELLRKAPGVILDNNNNVILDGKSGVQIFIDGKAALLTGDDLTDYLRTLQASDIAKIEIITQPSSKYDAAGNAGIINIMLKKDKRLGTNGKVSAGYAYGRNSTYNTSISLNNRTKKTNFFGSYSNSFGDSWNFIYLDRTQGDIRFDSETESVKSFQTHNARAGMDWFPADQHTIGVLIKGNYYDTENAGTTTTPIIPLPTNEVSQILIANNRSTSDNYNLLGNINYRFADTLGQELTFDFDYGIYDQDRMSFQPNSYVDGTTGAALFENNFRMFTPTAIDIVTVKLDYSRNALGGAIGVGAKYSKVITENVFDFYNVLSSTEELDEDRSNEFSYDENINAAYVNYSRKWDKWNLQLGLRMEQTISEGNLISTQESEEDNVKRNYVDWFPSGGLTFTPNYKSSWALTYSRRIQRPDYQSLNPFEFQLDELSFSKGNPFLQPQYTNNIKLSHTYKYRLTTSISYSYIQDYFAAITEPVDSTRNFMISRNIANQQVWNLGISYPFDVNKWWSVYLSVNGFRTAFNGDEDDNFIPIDQNTLSLYGQNTFSLPEGFKFELSGWFSSPSVWRGTYRTKSLGSLNLALQKKFLDDLLTVRVAANDIFFTSPWEADMQYGDLFIDGTGGWESRRVSLNLSYSFGNAEVKAARKRKTGLEDEDKRVGN